MSEPAAKEFEERKAEAKDLPVVKLEFTTNNYLLRKYDIVVIGSGRYIIISRPIKTEAGFTYMVTPYGTNPADLTVTLVEELLPEL